MIPITQYRKLEKENKALREFVERIISGECMSDAPACVSSDDWACDDCRKKAAEELLNSLGGGE